MPKINGIWDTQIAGPVAFFQDFPVLENVTTKFQDFPGFPGPV